MTKFCAKTCRVNCWKCIDMMRTEILKHSTLCNITFPEFLYNEDFRDTQSENLSKMLQISSLVSQARFGALKRDIYVR